MHSSAYARLVFAPKDVVRTVFSLCLRGFRWWLAASQPREQDGPGKRQEVGPGRTAAGRSLRVHHREDGVSVVGRQLHVADHSFTARPTLCMFRISAVVAANKMAFTPGGTLFGDGCTSSMTGEVMNGQTVLCILWTPFIFCPSIAVIIISCIFTSETLEAIGEWCRVKRRPHIIEVDVLGKGPVF